MAPGPLLEEEVVVVALGQLVGLVDIERRLSPAGRRGLPLAR